MFASARFFATTVGIVTASMLAASVAAADPFQVTVTSSLDAPFSVNFSGAITATDIKIVPDSRAYPLGTAPDKATIKWVAKPIKPENSKYTQCSGQATVKGSALTITLKKTDNCKDKAAAPPPPKPTPSPTPTPKPDSKAGSGSNVFVVDPSFTKVTVTFEYTSGDPVEVHLSDGTHPGAANGDSSLLSIGDKTTSNLYKNKEGEYIALVSWNCVGNKRVAGDSGYYRGKNLTLQFVQGCKLTGATKLATLPTIR